MTIRPLYLDAAEEVEVGLADGVALNVARPGRARSLYPLRRLSRVVSGRNAKWSTEALLGCLSTGVPVLFQDGRGNSIGWCFGARRRETTLAELLRLGVHDLDWSERYGTWKAATQRREIHGVLRAAGLPTTVSEAKTVRSVLCNAHRDRLGMPCGAFIDALSTAVGGLVIETLQDEIGDATLIGFAHPGLHLGRDFVALLEWRLHRIVWTTSVGLIHYDTPARFAARAIERHGAMLHQTLGRMLGDLELTLRDWLL